MDKLDHKREAMYKLDHMRESMYAPLIPLDTTIVKDAMLVIAENTTSNEECRLLLDMLGLLDNGNE